MLLGETDTGKTTTLWDLRDRLTNQWWIETHFEEEGNPDNDFLSEMKYKGLKLALVSMGDYSGYSVSKMNKYDAEEYDILVFACNVDKARPQNRFAKFEDSHIVEKVEPNDADNERAMREIIAHIQTVIAE